jgi:hypothetical protein
MADLREDGWRLTAPLVERLRYYADRDDHEWGPNPVSRTMREAADRIEKLEAEDSDG